MLYSIALHGSASLGRHSWIWVWFCPAPAFVSHRSGFFDAVIPQYESSTVDHFSSLRDFVSVFRSYLLYNIRLPPGDTRDAHGCRYCLGASFDSALYNSKAASAAVLILLGMGHNQDSIVHRRSVNTNAGAHARFCGFPASMTLCAKPLPPT